MSNNHNHVNGYYNNNNNTEDLDRSSNNGSINGSISSGGYSSPPPSSSYFYDLQMYSNTNVPPANNVNVNSQLYQNVREVPYHQGHVNSHAHNNMNVYAHRQQTSSSSGSVRQVDKDGITFVDPFAPSSQYLSSLNSPPLRYTSNNSSSYTNTNSVPPSTPQKLHISSETVIQPVYATFGYESIFVTCPYCHYTDSTDIEQVIGGEALLWACIIPCFGFLRKSKWNTRHRCKNCLNVIGIHYP